MSLHIGLRQQDPSKMNSKLKRPRDTGKLLISNDGEWKVTKTSSHIFTDYQNTAKKRAMSTDYLAARLSKRHSSQMLMEWVETID